ncbi:Barrel-sandwich domain of CusB or HlyD membrane-fusion [Paenibacillus sp. yr247]|uniref:efflux RND transporter periplasmic adaptor subunit n=1 Tax=Paenibacillus sp. yr247 TaxID=1761880 RepID=UPI0008911F15|nr:efflux RND transporter periplasmic adaptor subunit [Paenibacillus sp. yr247]SDN34399.1 Barrel-sandwich domain of CusB or HlyD membrane-fusion [Paenibacillus sp. yr247]
MKGAARIVILNVVLLIVLVGGAALAYYFYNQSINYLSTNNAQIAGEQVVVASVSTAGKLSDWSGEVGKKYTQGEHLGSVLTATETVEITAPKAGTIVQQSAVVNSVVVPGLPLAYMYDLDRLWVNANVKETDLNDVKVGLAVDVYVDAFPGTTLSGRVEKLGLATAGTFSLLPSSNTTGNYTKVTQVVPVTISLEGNRGLGIIPGMSVTARIHK